MIIKTVKRNLFRVGYCVSENHVEGVLRCCIGALERPEYGITTPHGLTRQSAYTIGAGKAGAPRLVHITTECRIAPRNQNRAGRLPLDAADGRSIGHRRPYRTTAFGQVLSDGFLNWIDFRCSTAVQATDDLNPWIGFVHVDP